MPFVKLFRLSAAGDDDDFMAMLVSANCGVYSFYSGRDPPLAKAAPKM